MRSHTLLPFVILALALAGNAIPAVDPLYARQSTRSRLVSRVSLDPLDFEARDSHLSARNGESSQQTPAVKEPSNYVTTGTQLDKGVLPAPEKKEEGKGKAPEAKPDEKGKGKAPEAKPDEKGKGKEPEGAKAGSSTSKPAEAEAKEEAKPTAEHTTEHTSDAHSGAETASLSPSEKEKKEEKEKEEKEKADEEAKKKKDKKLATKKKVLKFGLAAAVFGGTVAAVATVKDAVSKTSGAAGSDASAVTSGLDSGNANGGFSARDVSTETQRDIGRFNRRRRIIQWE
ncbi:hypothetical protein BT96DRAFT_1020402 [Gymnopus androsaceus JB14]|uniref:Uncharacterized protein n=1 Tax=Gymnopus androsaceus JB14 TaxID=1447944 RepID=A0A6A4HML4_9AGAR|nr:hypothetical protein BT96DRAFT_1020402 [Gymnopus androsaceus JB14]